MSAAVSPAVVFRKGELYFVDVITDKQRIVAAGSFATLADATKWFDEAVESAPNVRLQVRESSDFNYIHAYSYGGNIFRYAERRKTTMHR